MSKRMIRDIPFGSCPNCQHKNFVVMENQMNMYLTNRDGNIIDSKEITNFAVGMCCSCKKTYEMYPTSEGFIPMTPLRKFIYDYESTKLDASEVNNYISHAINPMQITGDE